MAAGDGSMTWDQFKEYVDQNIRAAGKDGSVAVEYIKYFSGGDRLPDVLIGREPDAERLQVWN
jgi:hypothetical protein